MRGTAKSYSNQYKCHGFLIKLSPFLVLPAAQLRDHNEELERELKSTTKLLRDTEDEKRRLEAESKSVSLVRVSRGGQGGVHTDQLKRNTQDRCILGAYRISKLLLIVIKQGRKHKFISAIFFHRSSCVSNTDVSFNNVKEKSELKVYLARLLENKAFFL